VLLSAKCWSIHDKHLDGDVRYVVLVEEELCLKKAYGYADGVKSHITNIRGFAAVGCASPDVIVLLCLSALAC